MLHLYWSGMSTNSSFSHFFSGHAPPIPKNTLTHILGYLNKHPSIYMILRWHALWPLITKTTTTLVITTIILDVLSWTPIDANTTVRPPVGWSHGLRWMYLMVLERIFWLVVPQPNWLVPGIYPIWMKWLCGEWVRVQQCFGNYCCSTPPRLPATYNSGAREDRDKGENYGSGCNWQQWPGCSGRKAIVPVRRYA